MPISRPPQSAPAKTNQDNNNGTELLWHQYIYLLFTRASWWLAQWQRHTGYLINICWIDKFGWIWIKLVTSIIAIPLWIIKTNNFLLLSAPMNFMNRNNDTVIIVCIDCPVLFVYLQANGHSFVHMEHEKAVLLLKSFQNTVDLVIQRELTV